MKELDFLPQSFVEAIRRRRQNRRNVMLSLGLVLALGCLHTLSASRIRSAQASLSALHNGSGGWKSAREQMAALELKKSLYRQQAALISKLDDAAPLDAAIGEISRLLGEAMAFRSLTVDAQPPPSVTAPGAEPAPATAAPPTQAVLAGIAASDVDVGIFLGKLSTCPLFSDVALSFSRETRASGRLMREFEVRFTLRPVEVPP